MPITQITIKNFKGIGPSVSIPLRPITLLFGANSAGKSTILQALLYLRELLERQNADADVLLASGSSINLGGFRQFVHDHDVTRTVRIGLTMSVDDDGLPSYLVGGDGGEASETREVDFFSEVKTIGVTIDVAWDPDTEKPWVVCYMVAIDGKVVGQISAQPNQKSSLQLFTSGEMEYVEDEEDAKTAEDSRTHDYISATTDYVVPKFGQALDGLDSILIDGIECFMEPSHISLLSRVFVGAGELVLKELQRIRYIGPIRTVPQRGFTAVRSPDESRWSDGSAAWDLLHKSTEKPAWLNTSQLSKLELGYRIEHHRYFEIPTESVLGGAIENAILGMDGVFDDLEEIPAQDLARLEIRSKLRIVTEGSEVEVAPADIGVGISQVLPVIIGAMAPGYSILSVEQPELHIHPAIQCKLADLLAHQAIGDKERLLLLETHSEHLILRLLRRVRELTEDSLNPDDPEIRPSDLSILYVTNQPEGLEITELPVNKRGDFSKEWPKGFFEERFDEYPD